jgi:ribonuclease-3 family protein
MAAQMTETINSRMEAVISPVVPTDVPVNLLSPVVLAYIGDAVFEIYIRQRLVADYNRKPHELHRAATGYVSAAAQARLLQHWMPLLSEEEADIVRRGRNTKSGQPPKNADPADYRHATALECLVGHLYYHGEKQRLEQLVEMAFADNKRNKRSDNLIKEDEHE